MVARLLRRAPALRRQRGQPVGGHARLRLRARPAPARARRRCSRCSAARSPPTASWPSRRWTGSRRSSRAMGGAWTARAPLPGGDIPDADFDAFCAPISASATRLPARLRTPLRPALRHARRDDARRRAHARRSRPAFRRRPLRARGRALVARNGRRTAEDILWRRTKHGLHLDAEERAAFAEGFSRTL